MYRNQLFYFLYFVRRKNETLFNTKSVVGRVVIVLLLTGGLAFAGTFAVNTFVPTSAVASNCCAGAEQDTASDSASSELKECCAVKASIMSSSSTCSCGYANCPGGSCICQNSSKTCGCTGTNCTCPTICASASYSCSAGPSSLSMLSFRI